MQHFTEAFLALFQGATPPDSAMYCEFAPPVERFITPGAEPYCYSVRQIAAVADTAFPALLAHEAALAHSRGYAGMQWRGYDFPLPPSAAAVDAALLAAGFRAKSTERLMYAPTTLADRLAGATAHAGIAIHPVTTAAAFDEFVRISTLAFGKREDWYDRCLRPLVLRGAPQIRVFTASVDGQAASAAWVQLYPRVAFLCGGGTVPELRGRGAYRALVAARLAVAHAAGAEYAVSECSADSERVLRALGFSDGGTIRRWWLEPPRAER